MKTEAVFREHRHVLRRTPERIVATLSQELACGAGDGWGPASLSFARTTCQRNCVDAVGTFAPTVHSLRDSTETEFKPCRN